MSGPAYDVSSNCLTLFEVVFMETAGYIIVGAICERITFWAFLLCELFVGGMLYPISGCWVWGGGWLSQLGNEMHLGPWLCRFRGLVGDALDRRILRNGAGDYFRAAAGQIWS